MKTRPKITKGRDKKKCTYESPYILYEETKGEGLKIFTHKQMFQRLPIGLAQVKAGKATENLLNKIRKIIYSMYRTTEVTKRLYNNIMNLVKG